MIANAYPQISINRLLKGNTKAGVNIFNSKMNNHLKTF